MYLFTENTSSLYVYICTADFSDKNIIAGWMSLKEIWNAPSIANQHQMCLPNLFWFYVFKGSEVHKTTQVPLRHHRARKGRCASGAMKHKDNKACHYAFTVKGICRIINYKDIASLEIKHVVWIWN